MNEERTARVREWELEKRASRELVSNWMINNGFATGHGDTLEDLLKELTWQVAELRDQLRSYRNSEGWLR